MNLKDFKIDLPTNWREISCFGSENQSSIRIYHVSPLSKVDPDIREDKILPSSSPNVTITRVGVPVPIGAPVKDYYEGMKKAISCGLLSADWTKKLDKLHKDLTEVHYPDDGDFSTDITIAKFQTEEVARQQFQNMGLMPTQGFNIPIPGGVKLPGLSENATITELLENDAYAKIISQYVPKEQLEKLRREIKKFQKQISEEVKPSLAKSGVKYKEGKYLNCDVIYMEGKNPLPPPKPKSSSQKPSGVGGGGGFDNRYDPLPKISQPYKSTIIIYQAILIKNFVITGNLLLIVNSLPSGITPCYSLTKFKKKISTFREGGEIFKDISIVPIVSNYAKEGYLYKEEIEEILKKIITKLSKNKK